MDKLIKCFKLKNKLFIKKNPGSLVGRKIAWWVGKLPEVTFIQGSGDCVETPNLTRNAVFSFASLVVLSSSSFRLPLLRLLGDFAQNLVVADFKLRRVCTLWEKAGVVCHSLP